jgi:dTMP kinase
VTNSRGKLITVEGQDGAGKSTNIAIIEAVLTEHKIAYVQTREPGGTQFGEAVRDLILGSKDTNFGDMAELLLMFAARAQHIEEVIEPSLSAGRWVVSDRFTDASYAYQGGGRGVSMSIIAEMEQCVQGDLRPDITLLLDLPVALGEQRAGERSAADRFEQQQIDFKQRVRDCYLAIAAKDTARVKVVDASQSFETVASAIQRMMTDFIHRVRGKHG